MYYCLLSKQNHGGYLLTLCYTDEAHVADGLPQPLQNARKLGVNFFETLLQGEYEMGLKRKFHRRKFF